jgi:alkylhydroperoxidase family enzyme
MTTEPAWIGFASAFPAGTRAMVGLQRAIDVARLEPLLLELVKMRASQINGCAARWGATAPTQATAWTEGPTWRV